MINDLEIWLERLSSLHKSQMRQAANSEGMQVVHLEILNYLSLSNKYSNTAQAVSEYLGQTKGSISQSLKILEAEGYVERKPCAQDKRVTRLYLTKTGTSSLERMSAYLMPNLEESAGDASHIRSLLQKWQIKNKHKGFGQCQSCRFNRQLGNGTFECGLTNEPLSAVEIRKICREHEFESEGVS
jgi:DNA-binding MarR family transcriptional regulator